MKFIFLEAMQKLIDRIEDKRIIRKYILKVSSLLEVIPYSKKEFKEKNPFIEEIIKNGSKITLRDESI